MCTCSPAGGIAIPGAGVTGPNGVAVLKAADVPNRPGLSGGAAGPAAGPVAGLAEGPAGGRGDSAPDGRAGDLSPGSGPGGGGPADGGADGGPPEDAEGPEGPGGAGGAGRQARAAPQLSCPAPTALPLTRVTRSCRLAAVAPAPCGQCRIWVDLVPIAPPMCGHPR